MTTIIGIALIIIAVGGAIWFYAKLMRGNPPLATQQVTIVSSNTTGAPSATTTSSNTSQASSSTSSSASGSANTTSTAAIVTSPIINGENPQLATETLAIDRATFTAEIASTTIQKANGLSFRPSLAPNAAMLFLFSSQSTQSFWMQSMNFPLDMIWISGNTVVGFAQDVPAPAPGTAVWNLKIYSSPSNTDKVLEVNAGTVAKYNIKVGDTVKIGG